MRAAAAPVSSSGDEHASFSNDNGTAKRVGANQICEGMDSFPKFVITASDLAAVGMFDGTRFSKGLLDRVGRSPRFLLEKVWRNQGVG